MLRRAAQEGGRAALAAFGLSQPSLGSVGIKAPSAPGLPSIKAPSVPKMPSAPTGESPGVSAAKMAFAVGMGASNASEATGEVRGEPIDGGQRRRSVIDRAFQRNVDDHATSSMPEPGDVAP